MSIALLPPVLHRAMQMDTDEWRFRALAEFRRQRERLAYAAAKPRWRREDLRPLLVSAGAASSVPLRACVRALEASDWTAAHHALAAHFVERPAVFPLDPRNLCSLAASIRKAFPRASADATARAERILSGRYDLLGYREVPCGSPPRWSYDPIHGRGASDAFWSDVKYLDRACGDHKVIWELNRHQHWLALARAFHLSGDRRFYTRFVDELTDWTAANQPLRGVNWASMLELGLRSLSWIWALHLFAGASLDGADDGTPWLVDLLLALDRQLTHVEHNLSRYFSPNTHLTGEALALYVAGRAIPELRAGERRATVGRAVLLEEIARQVCADGGHAELSAHYHRYSTDFYLLAANVARATDDPAAAALLDAAHRQARYLRTIADADGRLPLIGDDDGGQLFPACGRPPADCRDTLAHAAVLTGDALLRLGAVPEETYWFCGNATSPGRLHGTPALGEHEWSSAALAATGYYVSRRGRNHLVFDAGPHGYLNGGHAHADALSIVLTADGRPVLIDPGTSTYTMDPARRDRYRSTAMHNTAVVNGRMQSEPDGPFHWRTRTDSQAPRWHSTAAFDYAEARHRAYSPVQHVRAVLAVHALGWFVVDHIVGEGDARADLYWHVHPAWRIEYAHDGATLRHGDGTVQGIAASAPLRHLSGEEAAGLDTWAPEYGRTEAAPLLRATVEARLPQSILTFIPRVSPSAPPHITSVPLETTPGPGWHGAAFAFQLNGRRLLLLAAVARGTDAAPRPWGTAEVHVDGPVALFADGSELLVVPWSIVRPHDVTPGDDRLPMSW